MAFEKAAVYTTLLSRRLFPSTFSAQHSHSLGKMTVQGKDSLAEQAGKDSLSALQDNIARNGTQSYYYAHRARNTGEAPAPLPVHVVLETASIETEKEVVETIFTYQFLDDSSMVKVYIPLEGVAAATTNDSIICNFQTKSIEVSIRDYKPQRVLKLAVKELNGEIKPEECSFKRLANKVVVTLKKANTGSWSKLAAK